MIIKKHHMHDKVRHFLYIFFFEKLWLLESSLYIQSPYSFSKITQVPGFLFLSLDLVRNFVTSSNGIKRESVLRETHQ